MTPPESTSERRKTTIASLWAGGGFASRQLIRLGGNLIFSRLLFPEAFGLMAIINAFWAGLVMFSDFGIGPSIVQSNRGDDPRYLNTAWTLQIGRGFVLFAIACACAVPIAGLYDAPELTAMLLLTSIGILISGFDSTSLPRFQRHLQIGRYEFVEIAAQLAAVVAILAWLLIEPSVWALAIGGVVHAAVRLGLGHGLASERDRIGWDPVAFREIFSFGGWIFLSTIVTFMAEQADRLIVGRLSSLSELGVYSIAAMVAALPSVALQHVGSLVVFPALSRGRVAGRDMDTIYRSVRRPILAVGGLVVAGLAAGADPLIEFLYDDRYREAGWMLQVLALGAWFRVAEAAPRSALLAMGHTRWMPALSSAKMISVVIGLPVGFSLAGIAGGIAALVLGDGISWLVACYAIRRQGLRGFMADLAVTLWVGASAAIGIGARLAATDQGPFVSTLIAGTAAALAFTPVALLLLARSGMLGRKADDA